ncbi:MAG: hypothetical protein KDD10_14150 [Phaeodactylibacter sp.]|nr:hypothetical protein [Phaeodactylibacter sp.]
MKAIYIPIVEARIKHNYFRGNAGRGLRWVADAGVRRDMANEGLLCRQEGNALAIFAGFRTGSKPGLSEVRSRIDQLAATELCHIFHLTVNEPSFFQYTELPLYQSDEAFFYFSFAPGKIKPRANEDEVRLTVAEKVGAGDLKPLSRQLYADLRAGKAGPAMLHLEALTGNYTSRLQAGQSVDLSPLALPEGLYRVKVDGKALGSDSTYYLGYQPPQKAMLGSLAINWPDVAEIIHQKERVPLKACLEFDNRKLPYRYNIIDKYSALGGAPEIVVSSDGGLAGLEFELKESYPPEYVFESNGAIPLKDEPEFEFRLAGGTLKDETEASEIPGANRQLASRTLISKLPLASPGHLAKNEEGQLFANLYVYI